MQKKLTPKVVLNLARKFDSSLPKRLIDFVAVFNDKVNNGRKFKFWTNTFNSDTWNFIMEKLPVEFPELRFKFSPFVPGELVMHYYSK